MYVPIVCTQCGGTSQAEQAVLGRTVLCPLCGRPTVAAEAKVALPVAQPIAAPEPETPLSLDDAPPLPTREPAPTAAAVARPRRSPVRTAIYASLSLFATLVVMAGVYTAFRYGDGQIPDGAWSTFTPPDGRCTIRMPGEPKEEPIAAEGFGVLGGRRFVVRRWFEKVTVSFGWIDLEADKLVAGHFDNVLLPFRDRELKRLNGKITGETILDFTAARRKFEVRRYRIDTDSGKAVMQVYFESQSDRLAYRDIEEPHRRQLLVFTPLGIRTPVEVTVFVKRRVLDPGQKLRLYFATAEGKNVHADMPWVSKFLLSFTPE